MIISNDMLELLIAAALGVLGKFGYDKGRSIITNGKSGNFSRDSHDRECLLKMRPVVDGLERVDKHFESVETKLDALSHITTTAATAAATAAAAAATAAAGLLEAKK